MRKRELTGPLPDELVWMDGGLAGQKTNFIEEVVESHDPHVLNGYDTKKKNMRGYWNVLHSTQFVKF